MKIVLYSSQLASFIGRNPHTIASKIFNKLYENNFSNELQKLKVYDQLKKNNVGDGKLIDEIANKMENNQNLRINLDKICNNNISTIIIKKEQEELVKKVMSDKNLNENDKEILKKAIDGYTNKKFGTVKEKNAIDVYRIRTGEEVVTKIDSRCKKIAEYDGIELLLISKIDAIKTDGTILEIKNRMYKLFEEVREYEWLQVQAYLEVYNLEKGELVEYLKDNNGEMRIKPIDRDRTFWNEIVLKEVGFFFRTMINLVHNDKKITKYMKLSDTEQNEFIKKMVRKEAKEN